MIETNRLYDFELNDKGYMEVQEAKKIFSEFQERIVGMTNPSRSQSILKSKLEEASFYMTRAISESEDNHYEIITY